MRHKRGSLYSFVTINFNCETGLILLLRKNDDSVIYRNKENFPNMMLYGMTPFLFFNIFIYCCIANIVYVKSKTVQNLKSNLQHFQEVSDTLVIYSFKIILVIKTNIHL